MIRYKTRSNGSGEQEKMTIEFAGANNMMHRHRLLPLVNSFGVEVPQSSQVVRPIRARIWISFISKFPRSPFSMRQE